MVFPHLPMVTGFKLVQGAHGRNASTLITYKGGEEYQP